MERTLFDLFSENPMGPVLFRGEWVHRIQVLTITEPITLSLRFIKFSQPPRQGVSISAQKCELSVLGITSKDFILWADDYDQELDINIVNPKPGAEVKFWNAYNIGYGIDAWLNECGMIFKEVQGPIKAQRALCSDGVGPADFNSLAFEWRLKPLRKHTRDRDSNQS